MAENSENINKKTIINLSRNTPVALVVGAAGFLGSSLTDRLIEKNIQVIGVDNLSTGKKQNLEKATKSSLFHLLIEDAQHLQLEVDRLDYIFVVASNSWDVKRILEIFKQKKARLLFASFIELYSDKHNEELGYFKKKEMEIAKFAKDHQLNARVLRLGTVFGPRMNFHHHDPIYKLIQQALTGDLQKEAPLEFSTRALYIADACELMIKCMFIGATAQKIFDGVSPIPIKVAEIKQVLLDPLWYEEKGFKPTELPPWTTPNLSKTQQFLNWQPKTDLVQSLKETLSYFKDHEIEVGSEQVAERAERWDKEKKEQLAEFKKEKAEEKVEKKADKKNRGIPKITLNKIYLLLVVLLVIVAFVWPMVATLFGVLTFRFQISEAVRNLEKGEFDKSINNVAAASVGINEAQQMFDSLEPIRKTNLFNSFFQTGDNLADLGKLTTDATKNTILGIQALIISLKAVSGEDTSPPTAFFDAAKLYLSKADQDLSQAQALLLGQEFTTKVPAILKGSIDSLAKKINDYSNLVKKGRAISTILPEVVAQNGAKTYLILLQNNLELRPTGGFIGSYATVSFAGGKLKKLTVNDIYELDGQLKLIVEPPPEIKEDLGQKYWYLRDANWEPDFPTSARQAEWFYNKESGERVEGTMALDISAMEDLLSVLGSVELADYGEKITDDNLFEKAISHAEISFFPGSQAKKSFLTALTQEVFNKLFFVPKQNWPGIVASLGKSLEAKHLSIYLDNPKLFSYLVSQKWTGALPRQSEQKTGSFQDFLAPVEANLGANKANYYLDRSYNLETVVGKDGQINHRLRIAYTNRSPQDAFPGGKYKNRIRFYLPFGAKLNRLLWAEKEMTKDVKSFVDYGRTGYSMLVELAPKEQKTLVVDYQLPGKLEFTAGVAKYRLDVVKQAGTFKDPFVWKITYPLSFHLASENTHKLTPQEQTIQTDLSVDRSFEIEFRK